MLERQQQEQLNPESDPDIPIQQFTFQYAVIDVMSLFNQTLIRLQCVTWGC